MGRSTIFNGKIHYFYGHNFNSYVKLPEGKSIDGFKKAVNLSTLKFRQMAARAGRPAPFDPGKETKSGPHATEYWQARVTATISRESCH